jgi:F0F1-type ATP synthase membrane subunit c/vacuolar-type H+-ATPase subunit K
LDNTHLKMQYLKVNFIGLAMIGSVFLYAVVVELLKRTITPFAGFGTLTPAQAQTLKYIFVALAIGDFFLVKFIQKILGTRSVQQLMQAAIITFALCEGVAVFGLVLFLLGGQAMDFYTFMFLSLFYFWFFFPKIKDWEAQVQAQSPKSATEVSEG